jgi:hypothetical protein
MGYAVIRGAKLQCSHGTSQSVLVTTHPVWVYGKAIATKGDAEPLKNIPSFGMCDSMLNPAVAAATAAAMGVLTPMPCVPATKRWVGGQMKLKTDGCAWLTTDCKCMCAYAGSIEIVNPGQKKVKL